MKPRELVLMAALSAALAAVLGGCAMIEQQLTSGGANQASDAGQPAAVGLSEKSEAPGDGGAGDAAETVEAAPPAAVAEDVVSETIETVDANDAAAEGEDLGEGGDPVEQGFEEGGPADEGEPAPEPAEVAQSRPIDELRDLAQVAVFTAEDAAAIKDSGAGLSAGEDELTIDVADLFAHANDAYRNGDYEVALWDYEDILMIFPLHYGANVNRTLALLQLGLNDEALIQALACASLFPEDDGNLLNVQAAGTACGFSEPDIEEVLLETLQQTWLGASAIEEYLSTREYVDGGSILDQFEYNRLWNRIETELVANAQTPGYDLRGVYEDLASQIDSLQENALDDPEIGQLRAYLDGLAVVLGIEGAGQ